MHLESTWRIGELLAGGGFGSVFLATRDSDYDHVAKFVPAIQGAQRELLLADLPGSRYVVPVIDKGDWDDYLVLVMPRAEFSLRDFIRDHAERVPTADALRVLRDTAAAISDMASVVVHRDLKPENVLFLDGRWQVADFGIARYADSSTAPDTRKYNMTPAYAAPEQWRFDHATAATDVYAFGVLAFELLSGRRPFPGPNLENFRQQHLHDLPPRLDGVPAAIQSLVESCLNKAPGARPAAKAVLDQLDAYAARPRPDGALERANQRAVQRMSEVESRASLARSQEERRDALKQAAHSALDNLSRGLQLAIRERSPAARITGSVSDLEFSASLEDVTLTFGGLRDINERTKVPFDVIAAARIKVALPRKYDWDGREHSLWYCDAKNEGTFRWYETAFDMNPATGKRAFVSPFAMTPGDDAALALSPIISSFVVSWPFSPVDQGDEAEFVDRWLRWFGEASLGELDLQSVMPRPRAAGSWRRS